MTKTLAWYSDFFKLFGDLRGYTEFFLLDDLLGSDRSTVRFFLPFDDFARRAAVPANRGEYETYMRASMEFLSARNARVGAASSIA